MNSYELSRQWFDWSFENPEKISPNHSAIYFFAIEHCNRLGWKLKFGFPTQMSMDAIGIKKHETYIRYFNDLVEWGFFKLIEKSKNQYSANIISLESAIPKNGEALGKAIRKHGGKQIDSMGESIGESNSSIDKPITNNQEPIKPITNNIFFFEKSLIDYGFEKNLVTDWLKVRKTKKATNTKTAYDSFIKEIESRSCDINEMLETAVKNSWSGFKHEWVDNLKKQNQNGTDTKTQFRTVSDEFARKIARGFQSVQLPKASGQT